LALRAHPPAALAAASVSSQQHAAAQPEAIRGETDGQAQRHAGQLNHREQKTRLQQADAQGIAQHGQGRGQLAHVQRGANSGKDDQQCGIDAGALHGFQGWIRVRGPVLRPAGGAR